MELALTIATWAPVALIVAGIIAQRKNRIRQSLRLEVAAAITAILLAAGYIATRDWGSVGVWGAIGAGMFAIWAIDVHLQRRRAEVENS